MLKIEYSESSDNFAVTVEGLAIKQFKTRKEAEEFLAENDLESKVRTQQDAERKLRVLVQNSPSFESFKDRLQSFMRFYLGDPMPEPMRRWTWAEFQQFYLDNKSK